MQYIYKGSCISYDKTHQQIEIAYENSKEDMTHLTNTKSEVKEKH